MDRASVFSMSVLNPDYGDAEDSKADIQRLLTDFVLTFRLGNSYIYRFVELHPYAINFWQELMRSCFK